MIIGISEIDQITFDQVERCAIALKLEVDYDKLFEELISLQSTFKQVSSYRDSLFTQVRKHIRGRDIYEIEGIDGGDEYVHKTSTQNQYNDNRIQADQLWAYLISKTATNCQEMKRLISFIYSIPCSNAFTEAVFNHMKHAWTPSRNSMSVETIAAELQIRLNCKMKCSEFYSFIQNESELLKCARSTGKYTFTKKTCSS